MSRQRVEKERRRSSEGGRRIERVRRKWDECRRFSTSERGRLRESGKAGWKEQGERVETHILPTPTTSTTSWLHSCLHGDELYVKSTWTFERKKDGRIHSFPRIFRVRDFPFFHVDARRTRWLGEKRRPMHALNLIDRLSIISLSSSGTFGNRFFKLPSLKLSRLLD